ncbi:MAG: NAD(P)H-hydrate dehydratase [Planctomycetaceae bacterium]
MQRITTLPIAPERPKDAHKGTFGKVLIVAGSRGMAGAAALSGLGALRGGAGLVYVGVPIESQPIVAAIEPSYLTIGLPVTNDGHLGRGAETIIRETAVGMSAVAIGPGLGESRHGDAAVIELYRDLPQTLIVDADGLNALARNQIPLGEHSGPRILTPHPGEFARLTGETTRSIQARREELAHAFAAQHSVTLLLKGAGTITSDGRHIAVNDTGNPGMATGGAGDVLTGLIAALAAQTMSPFDAAQLGAWLHGRAGDLAAADHSPPGLMASDLPRYLGRAWKELLRTDHQ